MHVLNVLAEQYKAMGKTLHLRHLNERSTKLLRKADDLAEHFSYDTVQEAVDATNVLQTPFHLHVTQGAHKHAHDHPRRRARTSSKGSDPDKQGVATDSRV